MGEFTIATGDTAVPLELEVSQFGVGGLGGLTPVYQIRNLATVDSYLDFNDSTFKTSGWTTKQNTISAVTGETGRYWASFDSSAVAAIVDGFHIIVEYINTGTYALIASDVYTFRTAGSGGGATVDEIWDELLSGHTTAGSAGAILTNCGTVNGDGSTSVDTDYGGTDNLTYETSGGAGVDNAVVHAFLKADYDAGDRLEAFIKARTNTLTTGRFVVPLFLDAETYTLVYEKQAEYGPDTKEVTVT